MLNKGGILVLMLIGIYLGEGRCGDLEERQRSLSVFPIVMYNTDIGFGYGGRAKGVNYFGVNESLDVMLFNSTKGERTYLLIFSIPDLEIRQGKTYGLSLDLKAEYSKLLKANFFGIGPDAEEGDLTVYTDERCELQLILGRGFSPNLAAEVTYGLKAVRYFNIADMKPFTQRLTEVGEQYSPYFSLQARFDTSDSQIHPRKGVRIIWRQDLAGKLSGNKESRYYRTSLDLRHYRTLWGSRDVLAVRVLVQKISGDAIPLFELPVLGGGSEFSALRGFKMNRYRDKGKFLINIEYRFPLWKRLGGNLFLDSGSVWPEWNRIRGDAFVANLGWGLRYYLKNFLVRFDMGIGAEGSRIDFNFNHIF